jgi:hypothetical protein
MEVIFIYTSLSVRRRPAAGQRIVVVKRNNLNYIQLMESNDVRGYFKQFYIHTHTDKLKVCRNEIFTWNFLDVLNNNI